MADPTTTAAMAATAAAAGSGAVAMGMPPQDVIVWSILGGLVSLWVMRQPVVPVTWRSAWWALGQVVVSALAGIVLSTLILHFAPEVSFLHPFHHAPHWALSALFAALATKVGPWGAGKVGDWISSKSGGAAP